MILFRCFNRISTWELLLAHFGELTWRHFDLTTYEEVLYDEYRQNNKLYGSSYILPAPELGGTSLDVSKGKANYADHLRLLKVMMETEPTRSAGPTIRAKRWVGTHLPVSQYGGVPLFPVRLSHAPYTLSDVCRLLLDLNMIPKTSCPEDWAICGPGATSCLVKIFGPGVRLAHYSRTSHWWREVVVPPSVFRTCQARHTCNL